MGFITRDIALTIMARKSKTAALQRNIPKMVKKNKNIPGNYFDKHSSKNPLIRFAVRKFYEKLVKFARHSNADTILEVGSGEGYISNLLNEHMNPKRILATEYEKEAIEKSKKLHPHINVQQEDIYNLGFKDNSFDLVVCCEVLEHLENPAKALKEIKRVARKHVIVSVPNEPVWRIANIARGSYIKQLGNTPGHINHWSRRGLKKLLMKEFRKVKVETSSFLWNIALCRK